MLITTNEKIHSKVKRFSELKRSLKELSDEEQKIKEELKDIMHNLGTKILISGEFVALITDRARKDLDKQKIQEILGDDFAECLKNVEYQIFEVKKS